jgi:hypothetical protein
MTTTVNGSSVIFNLNLLGILYQIYLFETGQSDTQQKSFETKEWKYFTDILLGNEMIVREQSNLFSLTEGGRVFLQRISDLRMPTKTMIPSWN